MCPCGCLTPCVACYALGKLKQRSSSQRPLVIFFFVWKTAHFSCWPLTFIEDSDLERFASECCKDGFFFLSVCVCVCVSILQAILHSATT